jgi:hypothetical protein
MKIRTFTFLSALTIAGLSYAAEPSAGPVTKSALMVVKEQGYLILEDGSSFYFFHTDGRFLSGPLGWVGPRIVGTYKMDGSAIFDITGKFDFINRPGPRRDDARIRIEISGPFRSQGVPFAVKIVAFSRPTLPDGKSDPRWALPTTLVVHKDVDFFVDWIRPYIP